MLMVKQKPNKKQLKKQLIDKLSDFDKIVWKQNRFELYVHSVSRSEAITGRASLKRRQEKTYGTRYSTTLNNYEIELLLHDSPSEDYRIIVSDKRNGPVMDLEDKDSDSVISFNKQEAKKLCKLVDKQAKDYLAEEKIKKEKREERKERLEQNKKEIKALEQMLQ